MTFSYFAKPQNDHPEKVALVPPRRGRKNGAQAFSSSWTLSALESTSNSKWAFKLHGSCILCRDEPHNKL